MKKFTAFKLYGSLGLLFVITIVLTILGGVAWSVVSFTVEDETPRNPAPAFPQLATEWQKKIDFAMAPPTEGLADPSNPFVDKQGISSNINNGGGGGGNSATVLTASSNVPTPKVKNVFVPGGAYTSPVGGGNTRQIPSPQLYTNNMQVLPPVQTEPALTDNSTFLSEQMQEQEKRALRGESPIPVAEIYSVNDLRPLGGVGTGRRREVLFDSPVTKQSFSVPIGTRFRDGELESVTDDGVIFRRSDGSTLFRAWASDSQKGNSSKEVNLPVSTKNVSQSNPLNQTETEAPLSLAVRTQRRTSRKK